MTQNDDEPYIEGPETARLTEELATRLQLGANLLMDRLFEYLSGLPHNGDDDTVIPSAAPIKGLTLPASAMGWLSSQLFPREKDDLSVIWMGASMRDRLSLLKLLLPRATHLRVTSEEWPPILRDSSRQGHAATSSTSDMVGQDISFGSSMTVQSAVTMETHVPEGRPSLRKFLVYYYEIQNRPRIDMKVVPQLQVLVMNRIPPEWIENMGVLQSSIRLLRTERGCIYNLSEFLFSQQIEDSTEFQKLTHLKLTHCALGELSGLRGKRHQSIYLEETDVSSPCSASHVANGSYRVLPPLSRLPNLSWLSLAHNDIRSTKTALQGLASLMKLTNLDLSFNKLSTFRHAPAQLGNVQVLILSGNQIRTARGLDRLYSLEVLALDQNKIQELSDVAGLASLPQLMSLRLHGNPVAKNRKYYRVEILNLFRESRFKTLPPKATYRQLLEILPVLDGTPALNRELVGLRGYAFGLPVDFLGEETTVSTPATSTGNVLPSQDTPLFSFENKRSRRVSKVKKARRAIVDEGATDRIELTGSADRLATVAGTLAYHFSLGDVISTLYPRPLVSGESDSDDSPGGELPEEVVHAFGELQLEKSSKKRMSPGGSPVQVPDGDDPHVGASGTDIAPLPTPTQPPRGLSFISLSTVKADLNGTSGGDTSMNNELLLNPQSPTSSPTNDLAGKTDCAEDENMPLDVKNTQLADVGHLLRDNRRSSELGRDEPTPAETSTESLLEDLPSPEVIFPQNMLDDDKSALSSLGTNRDDFPAEDGYQIAEASSVYDGPDNYRSLPILFNLELYFRCFVFPSSVSDRYRLFDGQMTPEVKASMMLEISPRIQVRRVDRVAMEVSVRDASHPIELMASCERFNRVWKDDILACGKPAAKRLTPHRIPKRGFHGEVLFSAGRLQKSCSCRKAILCTSRLGLGGVAFYLIADYDAVTHQALLRNNSRRRFPSPIPEDAPFESAAWPHAVARHLIVSLSRITIGFGFQRLTLHFSNDNTVLDEFTYVVLTCNKLRTVSMLQHIQEHVKEVAFPSLFGGTELKIDNDDKQVLEALTSVVSPDVLGVVLHYQIVQQKWQHGDRGTVRRACVVTDMNLYLLDEDYVGDGSESFEAGARQLGDASFKMVDSSTIDQISEVQAANEDPSAITVVIRPLSRLQRTHRWRLVCRDREGAERLVEDVRKAMSMIE